MAITALMVKELRGRTGAGMMDCKKALGETNGDMEAAIDLSFACTVVTRRMVTFSPVLATMSSRAFSNESPFSMVCIKNASILAGEGIKVSASDTKGVMIEKILA
jgi:hypothetical protein